MGSAHYLSDLSLAALTMLCFGNIFMLTTLLCVLGGLCSIPFIVSQFGDILGYTRRLGQVLEAFDTTKLAENSSSSRPRAPSAETRTASLLQAARVHQQIPHAEIAVERITFFTSPQPAEAEASNVDVAMRDRRLLFNELSFTLRTGTNMLVVGPSGCGKVCLLLLFQLNSTSSRC